MLNLLSGEIIVHAGLEIKKILKSLFGDLLVKNGRQLQISSCQILKFS